MKAFTLLIIFILSTLLLFTLAWVDKTVIKESAWLYLTLLCELGTIAMTIVIIIIDKLNLPKHGTHYYLVKP